MGTDNDRIARTVFVAGFPWKTAESELAAFFEPCGKIVEIRMVFDQQGRSRGYAFVTFEAVESIEHALRKDGVMLGGRQVIVKRAHRQEVLRPARERRDLV